MSKHMWITANVAYAHRAGETVVNMVCHEDDIEDVISDLVAELASQAPGEELTDATTHISGLELARAFTIRTARMVMRIEVEFAYTEEEMAEMGYLSNEVALDQHVWGTLFAEGEVDVDLD